MKVGYFSDVHIDTWRRRGCKVGYELEDSCDLICFAGDAGNSFVDHGDVCTQIEDMFGVPVVSVMGNHEHYSSPTGTINLPAIHTVGDVKIASATLWTNFRKKSLEGNVVNHVENCISDFHYIKGFTPQKCYDTFQEHYEFLKESDADIVLTHFPMFVDSVHPKYVGDPLNAYFVNDLEPIEGTKLYIHGHTHSQMDYEKDGVRVVANPFGYPNENTSYPLCEIKVVEI